MARYIGILYRIKNSLPLQARLQIFHSFVQSHLNFCSLVWGFSARSNIESLFTNQKKGMRAVMPGYINYFYKDGTLPSHTKTGFNKLEVLTVHSIIIKNALIFMHKVNNFPWLLPASVNHTISPDAPSLFSTSNHDTHQEWLINFGTSTYCKSLFYKGPLIYADPETSKIAGPTTLVSIILYKNAVKRLLLTVQKEGEVEEWNPKNFLLYNVRGLRRSNRLNH